MVGFCLSWQWRTRHTVSSPTCGTSSSGQCPAPEPGLTCWHPGKGDIPAGLGAAAALLCCSIPPPLHPSIPAFPPSPLTLCTGWPHSLGASLSCSAEFRGERSSRIAARVAPAHLQAAFGFSGPSPVPDLTCSSKTSPCPGVSLWGLGDGWSLLKEVSLLWGRGRLRPLGLLEREHWVPPQFGCKVNCTDDLFAAGRVVWGCKGAGCKGSTPGRVGISLGGCPAATGPLCPQAQVKASAPAAQ